MSRSRSYLEVDLGAVKRNISTIINAVPSRRLMAVVKADAYGVGAEKISSAADACGCSCFGVASLDEALELRSFGITKPICMLSGVLDSEISDAVANDITLPLTNMETARKINSESARQGRRARCNFVIDSGMGRVGFTLDNAATGIREAGSLGSVDIIGVYSHLSSAGEKNDTYTIKQLDFLKSFLGNTELPAGCRDIHIAAFDGINNYSEAVSAPFNMARCGIGIYGMAERSALTLPLERTLKLCAKIVDVRELPAGSAVGYMHTAVLKKRTRIAVVAFGYADGLPLGASNNSRFIINGVSTPVIGRISMDYTTCSLADDTPAEPGDDVVIFGSSGNETIDVSEIARLRGSHDYDVLCSIGNRVSRRYING